MYQIIYAYFCFLLILLLFFVLFSLMIVMISSLIYNYSIRDKKNKVLKVRENGPYYIILYDSILQSIYATTFTLKKLSFDLSLNYYKFRHVYIIFVFDIEERVVVDDGDLDSELDVVVVFKRLR